MFIIQYKRKDSEYWLDIREKFDNLTEALEEIHQRQVIYNQAKLGIYRIVKRTYLDEVVYNDNN